MRAASLLLIGLCGCAEALRVPTLGAASSLRAPRHAAPIAIAPAPEVPRTRLSPEAMEMLGKVRRNPTDPCCDAHPYDSVPASRRTTEVSEP